MPMFVYRCAKCDHAFESLVRKPEDEPETCPSCQAPKEYVDRDLTGSLKPNHVYKGSGFYTTDYKKKKRMFGV